jgi:diguanylate cyclase (GGDEF)-like protein
MLAEPSATTVMTKPVFRIRSINFALYVLVSVCLVPTVLVSITAISYYYTNTREELVATSLRRATSISANVDATIKGVQIGLQTLSHSPALKARDFRDLHRQAQSVVGHLEIGRNIYLMEPDGRQLMNTTLPYGAPLPPTRNLALVQRVVATGKPSVSDVFMGSVSTIPLVVVAVPVMEDGRVVYVLGTSISAAGMSTVLINSQPPTDWIIAAYDGKANFLARTHDANSVVGSPAPDVLRAAMARQPSGTLEGSTQAGIPVFAAYARSPLTGWTVSVGIPQAKLLSSLHDVIALAVLLLAIALIIGTTVAMGLALQIRKAITALVAPAEALSRSEPVTLPPETFAETHAVALALQRTSVRLRQSEYEAQHDELTDLVNRSFLKAALPNYIGLCDRNKTSLAFLSIDLDGFKAVNDQFGHAAGDEVLRASARRIVGARRGSDVSIRMGGDEFALVLYDANRAGARTAAMHLLESLSEEIVTPFGTMQISASIGIALYPDDAQDIDSLLIHADKALYAAKRSGKNCSAFADAV